MTYQTPHPHLTIHPRVLPHRLSDGVVGLAVSLVQFIAFIVVATMATAAIGTLTRNAIAAALTMLGMLILLPVLVILVTVWQLRFDEEGLEFVRALGTPKKIAWANVKSVEAASQAEVVLRGWLWPPFPPREATPSLTSLGHYKIRWEGGTAYFPPSNVRQFLAAIQYGRELAARQVSKVPPA